MDYLCPAKAFKSESSVAIVHEDEIRYHDFAGEKEATLSSCTAMKATSSRGSQQAFPMKLHYILQEAEIDGSDTIISWLVHGRSFLVRDQDKFAKEVLPFWFQMNHYSSFQRQLNMYGFRRLTAGADKGSYYNPYFLRGKNFLARRIERVKIKGTGSRKPSTPETEPNFYNYPMLPGGDRQKRERMTRQSPVSTPVVASMPSPRSSMYIEFDELSTVTSTKSPLPALILSLPGGRTAAARTIASRSKSAQARQIETVVSDKGYTAVSFSNPHEDVTAVSPRKQSFQPVLVSSMRQIAQAACLPSSLPKSTKPCLVVKPITGSESAQIRDKINVKATEMLLAMAYGDFAPNHQSSSSTTHSALSPLLTAERRLRAQSYQRPLLSLPTYEMCGELHLPCPLPPSPKLLPRLHDPINPPSLNSLLAYNMTDRNVGPLRTPMLLGSQANPAAGQNLNAMIAANQILLENDEVMASSLAGRSKATTANPRSVAALLDADMLLRETGLEEAISSQDVAVSDSGSVAALLAADKALRQDDEGVSRRFAGPIKKRPVYPQSLAASTAVKFVTRDADSMEE